MAAAMERARFVAMSYCSCCRKRQPRSEPIPPRHWVARPAWCGCVQGREGQGRSQSTERKRSPPASANARALDTARADKSNPRTHGDRAQMHGAPRAARARSGGTVDRRTDLKDLRVNRRPLELQPRHEERQERERVLQPQKLQPQDYCQTACARSGAGSAWHAGAAHGTLQSSASRASQTAAGPVPAARCAPCAHARCAPSARVVRRPRWQRLHVRAGEVVVRDEQPEAECADDAALACSMPTQRATRRARAQQRQLTANARWWRRIGHPHIARSAAAMARRAFGPTESNRRALRRMRARRVPPCIRASYHAARVRPWATSRAPSSSTGPRSRQAMSDFRYHRW